jgi:sugar diacid utilization regulator
VDGVRRRLVARCRDELARAARLTLVGSSGERVVVPATAASEAWARDGLTRPAGTLARAGSDGVVYSELGILRLMLADPQSTDLSRFVRETVGPVLDYDREHGSALLETLRAYVESGCSQQLAAARWFVHVKTVKYRLVQVEKLTGLDLAAHHDRLRVDIAVRAAELFRTGLT